MIDELLTLDEAAQLLRLRTPETFARFAKRYALPLVRIGRRVVRVRAQDLDRLIVEHLDSTVDSGGSREHEH